MGLRSWWRRAFGKDRIVLRNEAVIEAYVEAGARLGDAVSYIYMGECIGFGDLLDSWERSEKEYAALGYRTLSVDDFVGHGGWGENIDEKLRVPRKVGEEPVYHAAYYRANYFRKIPSTIDFDRMFKDGQPQQGTYTVPTTEHLQKI